VVQGDRIGLVAFAGAAFIQCPLTLDYAALEMFLGALQPDLIPVPGTDLGAAIETGITAFDEESATDKVIVLITDGEDNEKRSGAAARQAAANGIKIFVFGIGDVGGGPIPELDGSGGFKKDNQGKLILSKLDEAGLRDIAALTGGTYVRSVAGDLDLDLLYFDGIKSRTQAQELKSGKIKVYEERFPLFVLAAFIFLLIEGLIDEKHRPKRQPEPRAAPLRAASVLIAAGILGWLLPGPSWAVESPDELYRKGRFAEAEEAYARSDMDNPRDLRFRYNRGCAAYQKGDYQTAAAAFASVLRRSENDDIRFKSAFNLGNARYRLGNFQEAADHFKIALAAYPTSEDARYNLELSLKKLQQQKEQQQQQEDPEQSQQQDGSEGDQDGNDRKQKSDTEKAEQKSAPEQRKETRDSAQSKGNPEQGGQQPRQNRPGDSRQSQPPQPDMSGELTPRDSMPPADADQQDSQTSLTLMDQKKAEALLDNIQENRSLIIQQQTRGRKSGVASGKDW
jgi:Ca-activated chloride channel family protein